VRYSLDHDRHQGNLTITDTALGDHRRGNSGTAEASPQRTPASRPEIREVADCLGSVLTRAGHKCVERRRKLGRQADRYLFHVSDRDVGHDLSSMFHMLDTDDKEHRSGFGCCGIGRRHQFATLTAGG
jgi:hypothetical protein